jgi:hypothetical protein
LLAASYGLIFVKIEAEADIPAAELAIFIITC